MVFFDFFAIASVSSSSVLYIPPGSGWYWLGNESEWKI